MITSAKQQIRRYLKRGFQKLGFNISRLPGEERYPPLHGLGMYSDLYTADELAQRPFINIGSGSFKHPYWTSMDYVSEHYADMQPEDFVPIDLMSSAPLPISDSTAKIFYTSHTIEHVTDDAVQLFFNEAFRCLEPGGIFRVTTGPDADSDYDALLRNDTHWFYWDHWYKKEGQYESLYHKPATSTSLEERWLHHVAGSVAPNNRDSSTTEIATPQLRTMLETMTKEELLDHLTGLCDFDSEHPGTHISWWNFDKISIFLKRAGFETIRKCGHGQSHCPILRDTSLFDNTHPQISVYVEAVR